MDAVPFAEVAAQQHRGQRVLDALLDHAFERPGAVHGIIAFVGDRVASRLGDMQRQALLVDLSFQPHDLQVDDLADLVALQRMKDDDLVNAIEELGQQARSRALPGPPWQCPPRRPLRP